MVLRAYHNQEIDKIQAREMLSHLDLSDKELYKSGAKKVLADIYAGQTAQSASYAAVWQLSKNWIQPIISYLI